MIELLLAAENSLALGRLDQAEQTFRQILDADPRNGIAAVGLSRVALERGDEAAALELARSALEIDPENATARRMIDRLEEISRHRSAAGAEGPTAPAVPLPTQGGPGTVVDPSSMIRAFDPAPIGQPGFVAEPSVSPAPPGEPGSAADPMPPAEAPTPQPGPQPEIPAPAPTAIRSTPARSRPAPPRPGLLRRLLRRP